MTFPLSTLAKNLIGPRATDHRGENFLVVKTRACKNLGCLSASDVIIKPEPGNLAKVIFTMMVLPQLNALLHRNTTARHKSPPCHREYPEHLATLSKCGLLKSN